IARYAFYGCSGLSSVTIPNSVKSIGGYAFNDCSGLSSVTIGSSVTSIGTNAFEGCDRLTSLSLADGTIPFKDSNNNFTYMNLKSVHVGRPIVTQLCKLDDLETLSIGNTTTEIAPSMWSDASKLTSLTLGNSLTSIGENAFSGCTALEEVIVPPSVETIGASAFAGNTSLPSIIMGNKVKTIGEKAFDGCPAKTVSITAQTPPTAPNNTFSNYTGKLYLQGQDALDAYYDALTCWDRFDSYMMIEPSAIKYDGETTLKGKAGDTFQLTATLMPENVTLPQIFWRSTNPEIATVDANGLVTLHADLSDVMALAEDVEDTTRSCKIIAESLYADGPVLEVTVSGNTSGVEEIVTDRVADRDINFNDSVEVYNLNGLKVSNSTDNLAPGIYIVRQGKAVKKISVK
ncbi:MAG: leucine-rich repeat protein, partial [Muribaculaceae bacterium]|nr:leucine-rich repeat protein [Muribaculaceae bacterium]